MRRTCLVLLCIAAVCTHGSASEADALAISANIQARHLPFGTVLDPIFASPTSNQITGYTRCGDSALWTGNYLAAEAFRFKVTQSPDALNNVKKALAGLKALTDVTGNNLLARCMVISDSPYAAGIRSEEIHNVIYTNAPWNWVGNTSRDQYMGVMFGLGIAYDMVDDAAFKSSVSDLVTRLVSYLTSHNWDVKLPDGTSSTTFLVRPDEMLSMVQVGRHVNPDRFSTYYDELRILLSGTVLAPIGVDISSDDSYFKFNLDYLTFYNLARLEGSFAGTIYEKGYSLVRNHTSGHQNAFFNMVDRGIEGPNAARDAETAALLDQWLQRPRRDFYVDLTTKVPVCASQACQPVPVPLRTPTDFLWQRSPFQLTGGGGGLVEGAGIDYILPYWMARYYGVIGTFTVQSAAANVSALAPESIASIFGQNLASQTAQPATQPPPTSLGGVTVKVKDAAGGERDSPLFYVSPRQINFEVPKGTAAGAATITIVNGNSTQSASATVQNVAPTLFSMSGDGTGVAAATAVRTIAGNLQIQSPVPVFQCTNSGCAAVPIDVGLDTPVFLSLYGTGIRNNSGLANVKVTIHGMNVPVSYAGPQLAFPGLDQVNVGLTLNLRGSGDSDVVLTVDGQKSNTVKINIQ